MSSISKNLFQTPIQISKTDFGLLNVDLVKLAYKLKGENNFVETTEQKGFQSVIYNPKDFKETNQFIHLQINNINNFLQQYSIIKNYDWNVKGIWFNINPKYSFNNLHTHSDCDFSAVYYLQVPKNSGSIVFENPNSVMLNHKFFQYPFNYNEINSNSYKVEPQEDMLILFPSYLPHRVQQNLSDKDRICLSFNFSVDIK